MTHRSSVAHARTCSRPHCDYTRVMAELGCCKRHVYNLYDRGELEGFYAGNGRGLRLYLDSVERLKRRRGDPNI